MEEGVGLAEVGSDGSVSGSSGTISCSERYAFVTERTPIRKGNRRKWTESLV